MKQKKKNSVRTITIAGIVVIFLLFILTIIRQNPQELSQQYPRYMSQNLKISFEYPENWYVDDRYFKILLTNYETNLNKDDKPSNSQIEILIDEFSGCHPDIEENLKDPACGEGGQSVAKNEIVSKEARQTKEGIFYYKYIVRTPKGNKLVYYLLEKGNKILQISKQPDPSQFEKEFEDLINSIRFL